MMKLGNSWDEILGVEFAQNYYQELRKKLKIEYAAYTVYPDMYDIFNAFKYTSFEDVKVVILGQDPYHGAGQAHGLSFSVKKGVAIPKSLQNIYKEIQSELGFESPKHGNLESWAKQGVLLLNTTLTVREASAASHSDLGWQTFTDNIIKALSRREDPVIFLLWGNYAKKKAALIDSRHSILSAAHPSPLSCYNGFYGCGHFSKANEILLSQNKIPINWQILD